MRPPKPSGSTAASMRASGPGKVLFGRMYEDASIELGAFRPGGRVFCIASAGCTAMTLAPRHEVVAVDINPVQLAYAERRFAGEPGVRGTAERVMAFGRSFAPAGRLVAVAGARVPRPRRSGRADRVLAAASRHAAVSRRPRRAPFARRRCARSTPRRSSTSCRRASARSCAGAWSAASRRHANRTNPYARALLLGELSDAPPPPEAKDIRLVHADAATFLEREPAGSFDGFALSNILDGAERGLRAATRRRGEAGRDAGRGRRAPQLPRAPGRTARPTAPPTTARCSGASSTSRPAAAL